MKTLHTLILGWALLSSALYAQSPAPACPAQAQAAGFTNLVFDDEFTANDVTKTSGTTTLSGIKWYPYNWAAASAATVNTGTVNGAAGVLTVTGGNVGTCPSYGPGNGSGAWSHGYFECRMQFVASQSSYGKSTWPAFWAYGTNWYKTQSSTATITCPEDDMFEAYPDKASSLGTGWDAAQTLHNWDYAKGSIKDTANNENGDNQMVSLVGSTEKAQPSDGAWHTYGLLWQQTGTGTGQISFYYDGYLVKHGGSPVSVFPTGAGTGYTAQETQPIQLILQGGPTQPLLVDWVHVWQAGTGTVTPPPALQAQSFSFTASQAPMTFALAGTTAQGQPVTYAVLEANGTGATLSGDTLTATAAGFVVLTVSQPGNATYAPYTGTATLTVP